MLRTSETTLERISKSRLVTGHDFSRAANAGQKGTGL
jgi:hypothetical protein